MSYVPSDIHREILSRLPAESVFRFRSVCKAWRSVINDTSFIKTHTNNQQCHSTLVIRDSKGGRLYSLSLDSLNYADASQEIDVTTIKQLIYCGVPLISTLPIASRNGLILISGHDTGKNLVVWNPLIGEYHKLAQVDSVLLTGRIGYTYNWIMGNGLGYDYATDDYKVVRIVRLVHVNGIFANITLVYSLKLDFWRMIKDCPCYISLICLGVFLNGALHWVSWDRIIVLDLGTEDYSQLPRRPIPTRRGDDLDQRFDALGGCLVLSRYNKMMKALKDG